MKRHRFALFLSAAAVAAGIAFLAAGPDRSGEQAGKANADALAAEPAAEKKIANHISINGVDVSGKTSEEARSAVNEVVDGCMDADIELYTPEASIHTTPEELAVSTNEDDILKNAVGYGKTGNLLDRYREAKRMEKGEKENFKLTFVPAEYAILRLIEAHSEELGKPAVDNKVSRRDGSFVFEEGESGYTVNAKKSASKISDYFADKWDGSSAKIELVTDELKPRGKKEDFEKMQDVLGTYTTEYGSSPSGRKTNIINGASKVDGSVLFPGDEISIAKKLAPITEENGYAEGTAYENGQVVPSVGGGVCQISSTLYNAAILAELPITQRSEHSMTVSYVEPSRDAAIAGDVLDLKFKNDRDTPIYIDIATSNSAITATVYGEETRPANRKVEFESEILSKTDPKTVYVADPSQPIGYKSGGGDAHTGYTAKLWKIVSVDGKEQSREGFNTSHYSVKNIEYHIGTASVSPEGSAAMNAAVASQDIGTINAVIGQWSDAAIAARIEQAQAGETPVSEDTEGTAIAYDEPLGGAVASE